MQNCKPLEPWEGVVGGLHRLEPSTGRLAGTGKWLQVLGYGLRWAGCEQADSLGKKEKGPEELAGLGLARKLDLA